MNPEIKNVQISSPGINALNPAFDVNGTITPATSSPISIGASVLSIANEKVANDMEKLGINHGNSGNISVRFKGGLIITPSRINYKILKPEDLCLINFKGGRLNYSNHDDKLKGPSWGHMG